MESKKALLSFSLGDAGHFTGTVFLSVEPKSKDPRSRQVVFFPQARTHWHSHAEGQTIIIRSGTAWIAYEEGGQFKRRELSSGQSFSFTPGQIHWHGASPGSMMEHISITRGETTWSEAVTDGDYFGEGARSSFEILTSLLHNLYQAEQDGNKVFFENHLSNDMVFRRASGQVITKRTFIDELKANGFEYRTPINIQINLSNNGQSAGASLLVAGKTQIMPPVENIWKNICLFRHNEGEWQLVGWYNEPMGNTK